MAITLGLTYKFKQRGWNRSTVKTVMFSDEELKSMRNKLDAMNAENSRLKDQLAGSSNKTTEIMIEKNWVVAPNLVTFQIGKSELSNEARVNLGFLALELIRVQRLTFLLILLAHGPVQEHVLIQKLRLRLLEARHPLWLVSRILFHMKPEI